jgi:ABC-2 type transport system ATP-binding protein
MKQKLALMCTLLHKPRILFLDEPTNGVDPVSRRDFWAILYGLVREGLTVFVSTAYLDEAERANRVAFLDHGRIIRCDTPAALRRSLTEACYQIRASDNRALRQRLSKEPGVLTAEPSGAYLHLFLDPKITSVEALAAKEHFEFEEILPSLEDVFIALIRKEEAARAA